MAFPCRVGDFRPSQGVVVGFQPGSCGSTGADSHPTLHCRGEVCWRCLSTGAQAWFMLRLVEKESKFDGSWLVR